MSMRVLGCLLVLAFGFALAQEACSLPAGVTPVEAPHVTAQQVENGTGSLMDFALSSRDRFREQGQQAENEGRAFHLGCLIRQEGSPWRSGSTYLVTLTPDGRIFVHAKDMSLSGRLLKPLIYGGILRALGINRADLTDPAAVRAAFAAAEAGNGGSFDIPSVSGASGYASAYTSLGFKELPPFCSRASISTPLIWPPKKSTTATPRVTASEVVDRATLKAFVTEAGSSFMELMKTGDQATLSKARNALRDPNGPWRHGSVYIYIWDLTSRD